MAPRQTLEDSIRHLRGELTDGDPLTAEDRALLERTLADVAEKLAQNGERERHAKNEGFSLTESLYDELRDLSARIEQSHPSLSIVLGRIIDSLAQLGF